MKKLMDYLSKPKGIYFSIVAMVFILSVLIKVSFSAGFIQTQDYTQEMYIRIPNNTLEIVGYESNRIEFERGESKLLTLKVESSSEIDTVYNIFYDNESITYELLSELNTTILPNEIKMISVEFTNTSEEATTLELNIGSINPDLFDSIETIGTVIK